jgi:hypothetical protein
VIEKFNFYDIYGYFVPGCSLLGLLWLPYGISKRCWPSTELGPALVGVVFAYIVGHVLQILSTKAFPSQIPDHLGNSRYSSEVFLDPENSAFSTEFKERLAKLVKDDFDIDLAIERSPKKDTDQEFAPVSRSRQDAFFLCRGTLIREKIAAYPEQFEGMYTLLRGLATACLLGVLYFLGWASAAWPVKWLTKTAIGVVVLGLAYCGVRAFVTVLGRSNKDPSSTDKTFLAFFSLVFLGSGHLLGRLYAYSEGQAPLFAGVAILLLILSLKFFAAYKKFAQDFARAVWRDYAGRDKDHGQSVETGESSALL